MNRLMRMTSLAVALMAFGTSTGREAAAQTKKLTLVTWTAPQNEDMFRGWISQFERAHPDVKVEWLDKNGPEWPAFYQTQVAAGTPPDIINIQAMIWREYAEGQLLLDLTPYLGREPDILARFDPDILR